MIKLIAIDLDGTLLNSEKKISEANKLALQKAKDAGVKIVLCTGRPLRGIEVYLEELSLEEAGDYSITFNGGLVQKNDTGEILAKKALTTANVREIYQLGKQLELPVDVLADDDVLQLTTTPGHNSIYQSLNDLLNFIPTEIEAINDEGTYNKAVMAYSAAVLDQKIPDIPQDLYTRYEIIKSRANLLEFMPKGVTKAYGISLLAEYLKITAAEVMAIGDEENDLPMIEYAGVGVAMANAVPDVKAIANYVTTSNDEDGVAAVIEKFVFTGE
ncbi:Cof-type HAD-IIB family hydrolase [Enterococcus sp. HY326]|uniref:Cof-type HAD-IIB family hydrolase n=1 Tax=Enterococcus sp. HY326 TaxID=2971265 RepID=UPI0022402921|nr:Cof-type HAD-IIB family hydrolase [Enterococcus sp. HY326]